MPRLFVEYPKEYREKCFIAWYAAGCPSLRKTIDLVPLSDKGNKPTTVTLEAWIEEDGWYQRRDELDARAANQIDDILVSKKVQMLEEQAGVMRAIRHKATEYLLDSGFDTSASAVSALIKASQEERIVRGISSAIEKLAAMGDDEVMNEIKKLAERAGSTIDMEEVETPEEDG